MNQQKPKFYITTAIAYASKKPHFGNTYEIIMTDAVARYKRERGYDVFFCTGTDEHGQKIENLAKEAGIIYKSENRKYHYAGLNREIPNDEPESLPFERQNDNENNDF